MSRHNTIYKETYNRSLDFVGSLRGQESLPSETELSARWGTSRTTVRAVLAHLNENGIIEWTGRTKTVLRRPQKNDYFSDEETISTGLRVESQFMELILGNNLKPGSILRESELVREFGASTSAIREFLIRFSRFGLIEKEPNRHWVLRGFTKEFAIELFDVREMFEMRAFREFLGRGTDTAQRKAFLDLEADHLRIIKNIKDEYLNFPRLDERFHRVLIDGLNNRFVDDFFKLVSVIFHYHYRWNKRDEMIRNLDAAKQHLAVIGSIRDGNESDAMAQFERHLGTARETLLSSVAWDLEN